jgi:phosphopantetheinyl transferase
MALNRNFSYSRDCALFGYGTSPIGVDVEVLGRKWSSLIDRVLAPNERCAIEGLGDSRDAAFWTCWTRKEAALKCLGTGIDRDLRSIDTSHRSSSVTHRGGMLSIDIFSVVAGPVVVSLASEVPLEWAAVFAERAGLNDQRAEANVTARVWCARDSLC